MWSRAPAEPGGTALGQGLRQFLEKLVVDSDVIEGTGRSTSASPYRRTQQGVSKDQTDEQPQNVPPMAPAAVMLIAWRRCT